jgi:cystathionine beta-synthase
MAVKMIEDAEKAGKLQSCTIIEGTSGNTGMGLAITRSSRATAAFS